LAVDSLFSINSSPNFISITATAAQKISVCSRKADVGALELYEKSICYVNIATTQFNARKQCINNGMALYNISSSSLARSEVLRNYKAWVGGSTSMVALILGRRV
jgi:hypothetical protein